MAGSGSEPVRKRSSGAPWKVDPSEVTPELQGNLVVDYLVGLTPEQESALEELEELDRQGPPPDAVADGTDREE
jgi:hypothetical protein